MSDAMYGAAVGSAPGVGQGATDALIALVDVLGREQKLLERLAFSVAQTALLLAASEEDHLIPATDEVIESIRDLATMEVARAMVVAELAEQWDLADDQPTLSTIHDAAPEAFQPVLEARRLEMRRLSDEIDQLSLTGADLAEAGRQRISDAREGAERGDGKGYGAPGSPASSGASPLLAERFA